MNRQRELTHLERGPSPDEQPVGWLCQIEISGPDHVHVLERSRDVVRIILQNSAPWPSDEKWRTLLPEWLIEQFIPGTTAEDLENWRNSQVNKPRIPVEDQWMLNTWLYWFKPSMRAWYWWDTRQADNDNSILVVEVPDVPAPFDALLWLLQVAGQSRVAISDC